MIDIMTKDIHEALFKLQGALRGVKKDSKNPHFKNSYASLEQVTDTIRPHMQEVGLYWMQMPGRIVDNSIEVTTRITHISGTYIEFTTEMPLAKRDPQGAGSSLTYCARYSLMAALGLPPTDDDAETAIDRNNSRPEPEVKPKHVVGFRDDGSRTSYALKKVTSWADLQSALNQDMLDVHSMVAFEKLKADYRKIAKEQFWNKQWLESLANEFAYYEENLKKETGDTVSDIQDTFPGARVISDREVLKVPLAGG